MERDGKSKWTKYTIIHDIGVIAWKGDLGNIAPPVHLFLQVLEMRLCAKDHRYPRAGRADYIISN